MEFRPLRSELLLLLMMLILALRVVQATTDPSDVEALQVLYTSLNSSSQLTGWTLSGGDPCGESWKGITCQGSAIVSVQISGLELNGTMGYILSSLGSVRTLDKVPPPQALAPVKVPPPQAQIPPSPSVKPPVIVPPIKPPVPVSPPHPPRNTKGSLWPFCFCQYKLIDR